MNWTWYNRDSRRTRGGPLLAAGAGLLACCGMIAAAPADHLRVARAAAPEPAARVVMVQDARATEALEPQPPVIASMVERGLRQLTGKPDLKSAWLSLVHTQDVVGIKVYSLPGPNSGTRPAVVAAVAHGLLQAGIPATNILIWDKKHDWLAQAGYYRLGQQLGIRVAAADEEGYDAESFYERPLLGNLVWGDHEFGKKGEGIGRKSFVSKIVTRQITKIINITPLLNHNHLGVTGHLFSLATGSVDNTIRFEGNPATAAEALPEIYNLEVLADRVVLNLTDGLLVQYRGEQTSLLHYSAVLNQLRFSHDPVALDALSLQELEIQRKQSGLTSPKNADELCRNAAELQLGVANPKAIKVEWAP